MTLQRFTEGIRNAEADRRTRDQEARTLAAESQKRPHEDEDINTLKDRIKEKTGKRPRFNGKEQLLDILEHVNSTEMTEAGGTSMELEKNRHFESNAYLECYSSLSAYWDLRDN